MPGCRMKSAGKSHCQSSHFAFTGGSSRPSNGDRVGVKPAAEAPPLGRRLDTLFEEFAADSAHLAQSFTCRGPYVA